MSRSRRQPASPIGCVTLQVGRPRSRVAAGASDTTVPSAKGLSSACSGPTVYADGELSPPEASPNRNPGDRKAELPACEVAQWMMSRFIG